MPAVGPRWTRRNAPTVTSAPRAAWLRRWSVAAFLFLFVFSTYAITAQTSSNVSVDVYSSSIASWRIAHTGGPWLDGVDTTRIDGYGNLPDAVVFIAEAPNGHRVSHRLPGVVAAAVPGYWIAGGSSDPDGFSMTPQAMSAALLTAGTVLFFFLAVRRRIGDTQALAGALVLAMATPVWSVAANAMWTHTLTVFGIVAMAYAASRDRWWLVGFCGGIAICGRLHVAVIVAVLGAGVALARRRPDILLRVGLPSASFLALTSAWTYWVYGTWIPGAGYNMSPQGLISGEHYPDAASPFLNQLGLWISPDKGVLVWTPVLALLLPAVVRKWVNLPDWSRWLALGALPYMLVQAQLNPYTGGGAHYAYRLGLEFLAAVAPAYVLSAHLMGVVARALLLPLIGLQVAAIGLGAILEAPTPSVGYGWTNNAFLVALTVSPVVGLLAVLVVGLVIVVGLAWRDLAPGFSRPDQQERVASVVDS